MQVQELINIILEYAQQWAPSVAAVIGVLIATLSTTKKVKTGIDEVHTAALDIQEQKATKELTSEVKALKGEVKKLTKQQSLIIDKLTKVKGYEDIKR